MTDQSVIFILSNINDLIMNQITIQKQQHSLAKKQVSRESAREVSNLLQKNRYDLCSFLK